MSVWSSGVRSLFKDKIHLLKLISLSCIAGVVYITGASFIYNLTHQPVAKKEPEPQRTRTKISENETESDGVLEAQKLIKDLRGQIKKREENKAFGNLMFGDDSHAVFMKMRQDSSLKTSRDFFAEFNIGGYPFFIEPVFYQNERFQKKLYKVKIKSLTYNYWKREVRLSWESLIESISSVYGPADIEQNIVLPPFEFEITHIWNCGKKEIVVGLTDKTVVCVITDTEIEAALK